MGDVLEGLAVHWASRPELVTVMGTILHDAEAPEGTRLPYAVQMFVSEVSQDTTTDLEVVTTTVSIIVRASQAKLARSYANLVRRAFRKAPIIVDGRPVMHCLPTNGLFVIDDNKGPLGRDVWAATVDFEVMYSSTYTL